MQIDWTAVIATLPSPRYRRSWFVDQCAKPDTFAGMDAFVPLLRRLEPALADALDGQPDAAYYLAVMNYCTERFPINEAWVYDLEEEGWCDFIPVDSLGFDPWEDGVGSPVVAACIVAHRTENMDGGVFEVDYFECLREHVRANEWELGRARIDPKTIKPPKGRAWRKPWDGLRDLYEYANALTGYNFLDVSNSMVGQAYEYPQWSADEVRALERSWRGAKPIHDRAFALAKYIDAKPRERLFQLAGALLRYQNMLHAVTVPLKPARRSGR